MSTQTIQTLIDKYFAGETSLQEEAQLRRYFQREDIAEELREYQPLFAYFQQARETSLQPGFERTLLSRIQDEQPAQQGNRLSVRSLFGAPAYRLAWRIAAAIALLLAVYFLLPTDPPKEQVATINWEKYEPKSEEEALAETKAALQLLAAKLNGGAKVASEEIDKMEKVSSPLR